MSKQRKTDTFDEVLVKLGERLKKLRLEAGKSQTVLAYECEMDKPNLRKIEKGKTNPTFKTLYRLSNALNISIKELVDIENK
jgi:transcriptional regulator with XRE-family HTH domain